MSGGGKPPPVPQDYLKGAMPGAVSSGTGAINNVNNMPNYAAGAYNSFQPGLTGSVSNASGWDPSQTVKAGNDMSAFSQSMSPYVTQLFQQGMDPQNALYGRTAQQLTDQVRAGESARGIGMTPYGAGVENKAMSDFNIDWQNNQLQRGATAASAGGGLANTINQGVSGGQTLAGSAPGWQAQVMQALSGAGVNTLAQPQAGASDWLNFINQGVGSQQNNYQDAFQRYQAKQQASNAMWSGIGSLAGTVLGGPIGGSLGDSIGGMFSGGGGGGGMSLGK